MCDDLIEAHGDLMPEGIRRIKLTAGMTTHAPDLLEEPSLRQVLGRPVLRSEDRALLTGEARYLDDVPCEGALYAVFVRSPMAHALVRSVDADDARAMPGVAGVFIAGDMGGLRMPPVEDSPEVFARPLLASAGSVSSASRWRWWWRGRGRRLWTPPTPSPSITSRSPR